MNPASLQQHLEAVPGHPGTRPSLSSVPAGRGRRRRAPSKRDLALVHASVIGRQA
jgi:hypothetical protein